MQINEDAHVNPPLPKTVVLALGNLLLSDEGMGIRALQLLLEHYHLPQSVECVDGGTLGLGLLAYLDEAVQLLVIDAVQTGREPGMLVRIEGEEMPASLSLSLSMHEIGFLELLAISRLRGSAPSRITVLGVEPESLADGIGLSRKVEARLGELVEAVVGELRAWGFDVPPR